MSEPSEAQAKEGVIDQHLDSFLDSHSQELVSIRRQLHSHPELSWEERETTELVARRLEVAGLEPVVLAGGTGLTCDIRPEGSPEGPLVALRADLDALPIADAKDVHYRSRVAGVAHVCGHDVHTAIVLGAGLALADRARSGTWDTPGGVRLIFQPAEETAPGGALSVIEQGGMNGVERIFGLHCDPKLPCGDIGVRSGAITSASDLVVIRLMGPGGHTARPYLTVDLVTVAAKVVADLTLAVSRLMDARGGANLTFGMIHAGLAANVIPSEATLQGTFRAIDRGTWDAAAGLIARVLDDAVRPFGAEYELEHVRGAPPVENDPSAVALVRAVGAEILGEGGVVPTEQSLGGDDFAWFLEKAPGAYVRLGVRDPAGTGVPLDLHTSRFDVDERAIDVGVRLLAKVAVAALAEGAGGS